MNQFRPARLPEKNSRERALDRVAEAAHRLNGAVRQAIDAGYSIELQRTSRHHDGAGHWGDQIVSTVSETEAQTAL